MAATHHDDDIRNHSHKSHFRLPNTAVPLRCARGHPIAKLAAGRKSDKGTDQNRKVEESNRFRGEIVRLDGEDLALGEIQSQKGRTAPRNTEGGELDNGEGEKFPGQNEVVDHGFEGSGVALKIGPLFLAWVALAEIGVAGGGCDLGELWHRGACSRVLELAVFHDIDVGLFVRGGADVGGAVRTGCGGNLVRVRAVVFGFGKHEYDHEKRCQHQSYIQPPEAAPAGSITHWAGDDWCNHQGSHIRRPIHSIVEPTL